MATPLIWTVVLLSLLAFEVKLQRSDQVHIGGFFFSERPGISMQQVIFRQAIKELNSRSPHSPPSFGTLGGRFGGQQTFFEQHIEPLESLDTVEAGRKVCSVLGKIGLAAIFGPDISFISDHIQSICDVKSVPHVQTLMGYHSGIDEFSINMFPHPEALSQAYADLVRATGWDNIAVIYQNRKSLIRLQKVLQLSELRKTVQIAIYQLSGDGHHRHVLRSIMMSSVRHLVVDCETDVVFEFLHQAQQVGMVTSDFSIFLTSLDLHTIDLENFKYSGCNITAFQLVDPSDPRVILNVAKWRQAEGQRGGPVDISTTSLTTENALLYDGVALFGEAFSSLQNSADVTVAPLDCSDNQQTWRHGESLINFMKMVKMTGLTGKIEFDSAGRRTNFLLNLVELREAGLVKTGEWSRRGLNVTTHPTEQREVKDQTVIVTTILKDPYTMLKESSKQRVGNDRYEGICVDLIDELSKSLGFNYSFHTNPDDSPGSPDANGNWNGMIGELLDGRAHFAISDLTITRSRQEVVDFSLQWLSLGIGLLYTKPTPSAPSLFSFLEPLSLEVWIYIALAYLGVSVFMFVLARYSPYEWDHPTPCHHNQDILENQFNFLNALWLSIGSLVQQGCDILPKFCPYEWVNPHPCVDDPEEVENDVNMSNGLWFMIGSLMQQGSDIAPKAVSTRMVAGTWWFFTLIMVSSYTANLAAFLTIETLNSPISSAEDLARQTEIKYGLYDKGSTGSFFRYYFDPTIKVTQEEHEQFKLCETAVTYLEHKKTEKQTEKTDQEDRKKNCWTGLLSTVYPFNKMWEFMEKQTPSVFEPSRQGPNRVSDAAGKYAYFMESSTIEYVVERRCDLTQVGGLLDNKGYGIAVGKNSPISARQLSEVILKMQENGKIQQLKTLWWKQKKDGGKCLESKKRGVSPLALENVGGVFVCLMCGIIMAVVQAAVEFVWSVKEMAADQNLPFATVAMKELRFVFRFRGNSKPVPKSGSVLEHLSSGRPQDDDDEEDGPGVVRVRSISADTSPHYVTSGYGFSSVRA